MTNPDPTAASPLRVTVMNGDLTFIGEPIMLGHYRSLRVTGTERVMDDLIGGTMQESLSIGRYPAAPKSNQVFYNTREHPFGRELPRPVAVIVVGLGEEGSLRPDDLISTIREGVLAWSQQVVESANSYPTQFEMAATLIGSGGTGISAGAAAQLIVQGVKDANDALSRQNARGRRWPRVEHLKLIELYLERATEAWQALRVLEETSPGVCSLTEAIVEGHGWLRQQIGSGYRGADYDFVSALLAKKDGDTHIAYSLDTRRARTEVRDEAVQLRLIQELVNASSNADNENTQIGRSLFQLLFPAAIKPFVEGSTALVLELEPETAGIPWELLDPAGNQPDALPWAIRTKLLRKLRLGTPASAAHAANAESAILIIGDPACDRSVYPLLDGAREEAMVVAQRIGKILGDSESSNIRRLIRKDEKHPGFEASAVINTLLERDWRILHISGHGEPPEWVTDDGASSAKSREPRGVVLSNGMFLGPRELAKMRAVPELVFVNCCHLAAQRSDEVLARRRFAAGVAESLIAIGVRCVVAAAWAVEDVAAKTFAESFYDCLMTGHRFIEAVSHARAQSYECGGNTWAAYQCYGDPDWMFTGAIADAQGTRARKPGGDEFSDIASRFALKIALDSIAVDALKGSNDHQFAAQKLEALEEKLETLEELFGKRWGGSGEIAQAFGQAWNELGHREKAVHYLARAVGASDSRATIGGVEQFCNARARLAWDRVLTALRAKQRKPNDAALSSAFDAEVTRGRSEIDEVLEVLSRITLVKKAADANDINALAYRPSLERASLWASSHKRRSMILTASDDATSARAEIVKMVDLYNKALEAGQEDNRLDLYYPGLNILAGTLILAEKLPVDLDGVLVGHIERTLNRKAHEDPDFWSVAGQLELDVYRALSQRNLGENRAKFASRYETLRDRVSAPRKWDTIFDTAYFVLSSYAARDLKSDEAAAATELLELLEGFTSRADVVPS